MAVAVIGCLPTVIVRFQMQATVESFDARGAHEVRQIRDVLAAETERIRDEPGRHSERDAGVLR